MKKVVLCIMDGIGMRKEVFGNAVSAAKTPILDSLMQIYPNSLLEASGVKVGLPNGQMGNSEVGHSNIGLGRIIYQPLEIINKAIKDNTLCSNKEINDVINYTKQNNSKLHIFGLLSDGGIHSHINHLFALIDICKQKKVKELYIHAFTDGRDTQPFVSYKYIQELQNKLNESNIGSIATISGRYYSMDRDNNWDRIKKSYDAIVNGIGNKTNNIKEYINHCIENNITDEFIEPVIINDKGIIEDKDGLLVFNFRPDRIRELLYSITNKNFDKFKRKSINHLKLVTMMAVSQDIKCTNIFHQQEVNNTLGEYIEKCGLKQLRIAETEKYAHVTYFFDGGITKELKNCKSILIPSSKVATYDLKPEMSANEITNTLLPIIKDYDLVVLNFANGDMVGHTGVFDATIKAVEVVDSCIGRIYNEVLKLGGILIVTADHGNSDYMLDKNNNIITSHSNSLVPFIITDKKYALKDGKLADIAPTILDIMGLDIPSDMTGESLIR